MKFHLRKKKNLNKNTKKFDLKPDKLYAYLEVQYKTKRIWAIFDFIVEYLEFISISKDQQRKRDATAKPSPHFL